MARAQTIQMRRHIGRRYTVLLFAVFAVVGGWAWFWTYAAGRAQEIVDGWRAREAASGRVYACGSQTVGGFPFRFEIDCNRVTATLQGATPLEIKTGRILAVAQVYDPTLLISEFTGPLSVETPGGAPLFVANWTLAQSSVRGTPRAPERASLVFSQPVIDRIDSGKRHEFLRAERLELHGRIAEGSVNENPVVEGILRVVQASAGAVNAAVADPIDGEIAVTLRGLKNFAPLPWPERLRQLQAADGRIEVTQLRARQGETLAVGHGVLALNAEGRLHGELRMTVAGLEPFLKSIGAAQMVQRSSNMDKLAGALNRLAPGLGEVARKQVGANLAAGINVLGEPTTLEGRNAVTLPLRIDDGAIFLGPVPLGMTPALF